MIVMMMMIILTRLPSIRVLFHEDTLRPAEFDSQLLLLHYTSDIPSPQSTTGSLAVAKRPCACCLDQFWPNVTGRRYFADILGLSSTTVT